MISPVLVILAAAQSQANVQWWVSTRDMGQLFAPQTPLVFREGGADVDIRVDPGTTYQSIVGLGSSLEHSTCYNISKLPADEQKAVIRKLVHPEDGIGMNLMRICIGTPDFTASPWYTYNDMPKGETDPKLKHFSIEKDREYVLPILKMALEANPDLRYVASPWSPPGWMTTNDRIGSGRIRTEHFSTYAEYFVKFIKAYEAEGIPIHAVTPQNEPDYAPSTYPTCRWRGEEQRDFIRKHLGPAFKRNGIDTEIWCWDHNFNKLGFPRAILNDRKAARYTNATAFHFYEGEPEAMTQLHEEFPDKDIQFSEGSAFGLRGAAMITRILRNWSRSYLAWVTIIDHNRQPNPGPHTCSLTCIVLNADTLTLDCRFDYYMYGQFMKFIQRGAIRVESGDVEKQLAHIAFKNPDGSLVLVATNSAEAARDLTVACQGRVFTAVVPGESVATFRWRP